VLPTFGSMLLLVLGAVSSADSGQPATKPAVSGIRAQLFQNKSGALSQDVLEPSYRGGWNTIGGPTASNATLIVVEVSGVRADRSASEKYAVKLIARETGRSSKVLLTSTQNVPASNDRGIAYLPFLVYQSGCSAVQVTAVLVGPQPTKPLERTLAFACGE
jgi:hypothetical protein